MPSSHHIYKSFISIVLFLLFCCTAAYNQTTKKDSISLKQLNRKNFVVNRHKNDSLRNSENDSIKGKKKKPGQIDAQIDYNATDSLVFLGNGTGVLYGKSDVKYKDIQLKSNYIRVKMDSSLIYAHGTLDSIGKLVGNPEFSEGAENYNSKELTYNLKTKKGIIRQAVTQQGEGYIIGDKTKKTAEDILCITDGKYTTCNNHDHPDFYLNLTKGKVKPGGYVVAGPAYLVVADVPLPLWIPFGFFPFTSKYSSGILMPNYQDELNRGFGLTNGGYYFAISDYVDLQLVGEIYTKGTWSLTGTSKYIKKYKFNGDLSVSYREDVTSEKGMPDYGKSKNFNVRWVHSQDSKANPYFSFSSSVNYSTSGYYRSNINTYYVPQLNSQNTKASSVSFTKRFPESPFNISGSLLINQTSRDSTINLTLPNVAISMSRIYPFKRKNVVGKERWYEKISLSYSGSLVNSVYTKEKLLFTSASSKDWKNGMRHSIPVSASFKMLKYIDINPTFNYNERWYLQSYDQHWGTVNGKGTVITDTVSGFKRVYDFNMGVSLSTTLYGYYIPLRSIFGDKIDRIRHVFKPSIGFSYNPDFSDSQWGYYGTYVRTSEDYAHPGTYFNETVKYSHYLGSVFGSPGGGKSGSINYSLSNNLEMKMRNDNDTTGNKPFKKISLIDNFSISGSYNLAADSLRWSVISSNLRLKFGSNYTLSLSGGFQPYFYGLSRSGSPVLINKLRWEHGRFPRFTGTSTSFSYTLNNSTVNKLFGVESTKSDKDSDKKDKKNLNEKNSDLFLDKKNLQATNNDEDNKKLDLDADGYEKVSVPWSINISYSVRYSNTTFNYDKMEYNMGLVHNLSLSGNLNLTKNWQISSSTSYDFKVKQFTYTNFNVTRNLHCWTMRASIVPFGYYKSYSFFIGVNSSMLQDLKYQKQSGYGGTPVTWY